MNLKFKIYQFDQVKLNVIDYKNNKFKVIYTDFSTLQNKGIEVKEIFQDLETLISTRKEIQE